MNEDRVKYLQATSIIANALPSTLAVDLRYQAAEGILDEILDILEVNLNVDSE
jgi:hypothetical protein